MVPVCMSACPAAPHTFLMSIAGSVLEVEVSAEHLLCAGHGARWRNMGKVDKGNHLGIRGAEVQPLFSGSGKPSQSRRIWFPAEQPVWGKLG